MVNNFNISVQTNGWYTTLFAGDLEADAAFSFIRDCGFNAIDYNFDKHLPASLISCGELNSFFDKPMENLLEYFAPVKVAAEKYGISFAQGHGLYPMHLENREDIDEYVLMATEKLLEICGYLGCPALVVHPVNQWSWEENCNMYRKLIPMCKRTGVKVCMENLFVANDGEMKPFCKAVDACRYIDMLNEEAGMEAFGFCYDVGHANFTGCDFREDLNALGHRLTVLHIHDNNGSADQHLIPYTQKYPVSWHNCTDWDGLIEGLRNIKFRGAINFETDMAFKNTPNELAPDLLRFIAAIGRYFKRRLME